jgi:single-stranded-DNA-specific exonuclease
MASRLNSRFKAPALVAAVGEETVTGSLRSWGNYDLRFLLEPNADLFLDWGGHDYAAGFSMVKSNWEAFLERVKAAAENIELAAGEDTEALAVDAELPLSYLTPDLFKIIDRFEPYGEGNDALMFLAKGLTITDISLMGKTEAKHVKLTLDAGKYKWPGVYWQAADKVKRDFDVGDQVDVVFRAARNWFNGNETLQILVSDLRRSEK